MSKKTKLAALGGIILFVLYNIVVFALGGFVGHPGTFWVSYVFVLLGTAIAAFIVIKLGDRRMLDWLFHWPIVKHSVIYLTAELIVSAVFMVFAERIGFGAAITVQVILLGVYGGFVISCLIAKETIKEVQLQVKKDTNFIRLLRADVEKVAIHAEDPQVKAAFTKLAEQIRYSDPVSNPILAGLEGQLAQCVNAAGEAVENGDLERALALCDRAAKLLMERNDKCKILK